MLAKKLRAYRMMNGLTQRAVAEKLGLSYQAYGYYEKGASSPNPTTLQKLAEVFGVTVNDLLNDEPIILKGTESLPEFVYIPILAETHCGAPMFAVEESEPEKTPVPKEYEGCTAFRCRGDSMNGARIYDGDLVFIREQATANNGDIVLVTIEDDCGEYTGCLKRYFRYGDMLVLNPENPDYSPMAFSKEEMNRVHIVGVAVGCTFNLENKLKQN